jgi:hypothetical protein
MTQGLGFVGFDVDPLVQREGLGQCHLNWRVNQVGLISLSPNKTVFDPSVNEPVSVRVEEDCLLCHLQLSNNHGLVPNQV